MVFTRNEAVGPSWRTFQSLSPTSRCW